MELFSDDLSLDDLSSDDLSSDDQLSKYHQRHFYSLAVNLYIVI